MEEQQRERNFKVKRVSMVDQVCENIKSMIINKELGNGDKLPSESELADIFGVNRLTVRMALQKLSTIGLVKTRVGEGSYVQDFSFIPYLNEISDIYLSTANLREICALRKLIELECTKLAIIKSTPADMENMRHSLDAYLKSVTIYRNSGSEHDLNEMVERDLDFHAQICYSSQNILLKDIFKLLRPLIKEHLSSLLIRRDQEWLEAGCPNTVIEPHEQLYNCILNGDWKACKQIYLELIDFQQEVDIDE